MAETLRIVASMLVAPGKRDALLPEMKKLVDDTRAEVGCIRYDLFQGDDNPDVLVFIEEWETRPLWEAHMKGEAIRAFNARIHAGAFAAGEVHPLTQIA